MEEQEIITKVTEQTEWVNSMTYPVKPNNMSGSKGPKQGYYQRTSEEITPKLCGTTNCPKWIVTKDSLPTLWTKHPVCRQNSTQYPEEEDTDT